MSVKRFSAKEIEILKQNPNVKHVTEKSITYEDHFKESFMEAYQQGKLPRMIFEDAGFNIEVLGDRYRNAAYRWKAQAKRLEGFKDTRKTESGRPRQRTLSDKEIIERQRAEIEYLKQERDFLLELKRLERQAIKKERLSPKKNTKSSSK